MITPGGKSSTCHWIHGEEIDFDLKTMITTRLTAKIHNALAGFPVNFRSKTEMGLKDNFFFTIGNIYGTVKKIPYDEFCAEFSILEELAMIYVNKSREEGLPISADIWAKMNRGDDVGPG